MAMILPASSTMFLMCRLQSNGDRETQTAVAISATSMMEARLELSTVRHSWWHGVDLDQPFWHPPSKRSIAQRCHRLAEANYNAARSDWPMVKILQPISNVRQMKSAYVT
jgi:hypothetical protein